MVLNELRDMKLKISLLFHFVREISRSCWTTVIVPHKTRMRKVLPLRAQSQDIGLFFLKQQKLTLSLDEYGVDMFQNSNQRWNRFQIVYVNIPIFNVLFYLQAFIISFTLISKTSFPSN